MAVPILKDVAAELFWGEIYLFCNKHWSYKEAQPDANKHYGKPQMQQGFHKN